MNSAQRLLRLIKDARQRPGTMACYDVWCDVLGVPNSDESLLIRRYSQVLQLVEEVCDELQRIEDLNTNLYLSWLTPVQKLFHIRYFTHAWKDVSKSVSEKDLHALEFAEHELSRRPQAGQIPKEELQELQIQVVSLQEKVVDARIDDRVKAVLVRQLDCIRESLLEYRLRGARAVRESLESAAGSVLVHGELFRTHKERPEVEAFGRIIGKMDRVLALATKAKQLVMPVFDFLG